ncbi:MAG: PQQ-binding-like beta-propeller repeat protein [Phycisphaerales bacterium]
MKTLLIAALSVAASAAIASPAQAQTPTAQEMRERLEKSLVLGPTAIEEMGVRHLWQQRMAMPPGTTALRGWMRGDSAFVLDSRGGISRLSLGDGSVIWRSEVLGPQDRVLGIHRARLDGRDRVFAVIDSEFIQLDGTTGGLISRKPSKEYLSADCAVAWPYLIFASASGRVVWFHALLGVIHHQGLVNGAIRGTPQVIGNEIVAAGTSGEVAGFIKEDARMLWRRNIGPVFGRLAEDTAGVYAASTDQSVYCLDRQSGKTRWKYFTESPITGDLSLFGDALLVQVPSEGLVCLATDSKGNMDGVRRWATDAPGTIAGSIGPNIVVVDAASRMLRVLELSRGGLVATVPMGAANDLTIGSGRDGNLLVVASDGRVQLLEPKGAKPKPSGLKIIPAAKPSDEPAEEGTAAEGGDEPAADDAGEP